jgi:hypothetical protein
MRDKPFDSIESYRECVLENLLQLGINDRFLILSLIDEFANEIKADFRAGKAANYVIERIFVKARSH